MRIEDKFEFSLNTSVGQNCQAITFAITKILKGHVLWFDAPVELLEESGCPNDESAAGADPATATKK